jgi:NADPH:quinone reductase-like Zn-dependent oxidoreductase
MPSTPKPIAGSQDVEVDAAHPRSSSSGGPAGIGAVPTRMRAAFRDRYGPTSSVQVGDLPVPVPAAGEVLLEVHAAGVDRGVWHLMAGLPYAVRVAGFGIRRPKQPVLGGDVAGRVVALGPEVSGLQVGDAVLGTGNGTFAEYAVARAADLVPKPRGLSFTAAATVAVSGLTAWQAVHEVARVSTGQTVLVLGASGGVGSFAVQLAQAAGAEVTGVASRAKLDLVASLGAAHVIDYTEADPVDGSIRYDVILDTGGLTPLSRLRRGLSARGTLVIVGGENGGRLTGGVGRQLRAVALSPWVKQRLTTFISSPSPERLEHLRAALEDGLAPAVEHTYPLEEAVSALDDLVAGGIRGKAAIEIRTSR